MKKSILTLLSAAFATLSISSVSGNSDSPSSKPETYVLVHGAWQAPYVWDAVRTDLEKKGNTVVVVELPGHGKDQTLNHTLTLDIYRDKIIDVILNLQGEVILVGHSMGGMAITAVAERIPAKIRKLVYIGAFIPTSGQALTDLAYSDADSKLGPALVPSADRLTLDVKREEIINLFINDGSSVEKERVLLNYRAEPAIPFTSKVTLTKQNFGSVQKVYIKTLQDIVISPGLQQRMIADAGVKTIYEINAGHSPFLSQPRALSDLLIKAAR